MKRLMVFNLIIVSVSALITWLFPEHFGFWALLVSVLFSVFSFGANFFYKTLKSGENLTAPFFLNLVIRFLLVGLLTLYYVKIRDIDKGYYVGVIFIIYLSHLVFELKYILYNLREN